MELPSDFIRAESGKQGGPLGGRSGTPGWALANRQVGVGILNCGEAEQPLV
jgi:hypothetical protein